MDTPCGNHDMNKQSVFLLSTLQPIAMTIQHENEQINQLRQLQTNTHSTPLMITTPRDVGVRYKKFMDIDPAMFTAWRRGEDANERL